MLSRSLFSFKKIPLKRLISKHEKATTFKFENKGKQYQKRTILKRFDYKDKTITFPVTIPLKRINSYAPSRLYLEERPDPKGYIKFANLSGNEILLAMLDAEHFSNHELSDCLDWFSKQNLLKEHNWNDHEIFQHFMDVFFKKMDTLNRDQYYTTLMAINKIRVSDPQIIQKYANDWKKMMPRLKGDKFADVYNILMESKIPSKEFKEEMTAIIPREIELMSPASFTRAFKNIVEHGFLTEYLWEYHFHMAFWKRNDAMAIADIAVAVDKMIEIEYFDEPEFWNVEFLSSIDLNIQKCDNADDIIFLIEGLTNLGARMPEVEVQSFIKKLSERLSFVEHRLPLIQKGTFANIVRNDLKYYEEKRRLELLQEMERPETNKSTLL